MKLKIPVNAGLMIRIKILPVLPFLFAACDAFCQAGGPINTDRPDQSNGVYTLSKHYFQLETGLIYGNESGNYFLHNTMLRYGLLSKTEIRPEFDYGKQYGMTGIMPATISIKQGLIEQKGIRPAITLVGDIGVPFLSTGNFKPDKIPGDLILAFENELSDQLSLSYNLGTSLDGESNQLSWLITTNLGFSPLEKLSFFVEYFSYFAHGLQPDHNLDAGVLWLLKDNLQVDLAAGTSILSKPASNQFITTGISYRFGQ